MDGVKLLIQKPGDDVWQRHFYNGWTHSYKNSLGTMDDSIWHHTAEFM